MAIYLKQFETQAAYEAAESGLILPNVSLTLDNNTVHYNPSSPVPPTPTETRVVAKFNVTDTSRSTKIANSTSNFSEIEIDDSKQPSVVSAYTFSTTGEHTVKYTLTDPTTIGDSVFYNCSSLTSIDIPNSVTSIESTAFVNCSSLTSIDIPSGVTSIGSGVFSRCSGLTSIYIPSGVTSIGDEAFSECSGLISCTIGNGVTSIGNDAFYGCSGLISIVSNRITAPTIKNNTFSNVKTGGTLTVPSGSSGYDVWMGTRNYYLGKYNWKKVEK